eukprot:scaffold109909_cov15-Tisochrysis_lutea.AAC.1
MERIKSSNNRNLWLLSLHPPLAPVPELARLLQKRGNTEAQQQTLEITSRSASQLNKLMQDVGGQTLK